MKWMMMVTLVFLAGCTTVGPVLTSLIAVPSTDPTNLQSGVKTATAEPIFLEPGGKTVCVFFGDNSGHQLDLRYVIEEKIRSKGYEIVEDQKQADYIVNARLTYLGYCKNYADQPALGRILGTATGAGIGSAIGHGSSGRSLAWGGALGLVGFAVGDAIDRANTPEMYFGELHLLIKQRLDFIGEGSGRPIVNSSKKTVTKTQNGKSQTTVVEEIDESSLSPIETGVSSARSGSSNVKSTTQTKVADYDYHQTALYGLAKVLKKDTASAVNELANYFANSIAGIF